MANTTLSHSELLTLVKYAKVFSDTRALASWDWESIATVVNMGDGQGDTWQAKLGLAGMPVPQETGELTPAYYADMPLLGDVDVTVTKYTLGSAFSEELLGDSIHIKDLAGKAGKKAKELHQYLADATAARPFNRAFNSSFPLYDGVELAGAHTTVSGDAYTNELAATSVTFDSIWSDILTFTNGNLVNHMGQKLAAKRVSAIIAHPSQEPNYRKIFESSGEPDTADNNANTLQGKNIKVIYNPFLESTTARFYITEDFKEDFIFVWRWKPKVDRHTDFDRGGIKVLTKSRFGTDVIDYLNILGTLGA